MAELLAPAGDINKLKYALHYGADAVYIGGKDFSLRANANNASVEEIKEGCEYAHKLNKKVYITVNIVFHEDDFEGLLEYLQQLEMCHVDGVIVSDIYVIKLINDYKLNLNIVLSTQCSSLNKYSAEFYKKLNVKRIVLAREALKEDISSIIDTGIETEVFIHGAMCTSISGKCVMSNYVTNRDSNRGGCAQICRFKFNIENNSDAFSMMPKDLNMVCHIEELIQMGVTSFKIEGRMRSIYYIATVIIIYRKLIDLVKNNSLTKEYTDYSIKMLNRVANRESVPQFFDKYPGVNEQYYFDKKEISNQDFLGLVLDYDKDNNEIVLETRNYFEVGTEIQIFGPETEIDMKIDKIYDEKNNEIKIARHPGEIVKIPCKYAVCKDDMMRIKVFDFL